MSAIDDKYAALGGPGGFLGQPTSSEAGLPDGRGRHRHFQGGSIYWSPETGAHEVVTAKADTTPPDFERPMPSGYPSLDALRAGGWLPVPPRATRWS